MRTLVIDTSGIALTIALFENATLIASRHEVIGRGHAESVVQWISELPGGGRAHDICVGCGPGSFTGIRAGVAAAHGLGLGWKAETRGVNSLALIASGSADQKQEVLVAIEGGHGELFLQAFTMNPVQQLGKAVSLTVAQAAETFHQEQVVGNAAAKFVNVRGYGQAREANPDAKLWQRLDARECALPVTPIYIRAPDAKPPPLFNKPQC